jgi:hypothetical protein
MSEKREFTGAFIPAHIWVSKELIPAEKMILGEIDCLSKKYGYCDASRAHFAEWLSCTDQNITYYFSKLEKLGFIQIEKIPGKRSRIRLINARFYENVGVKGTDGRGKGDLRVGVKGTDGRGKGDLPEIKEEIQDKIKDKETSAAEKTAAGDGKIFTLKTPLPEKPPSSGAPPTGPAPKFKYDLPENYTRFNNPEAIAELWERWVGYRKARKPAIKTEDEARTSLKKLWEWTKGDTAICTKIVEKSIANGWQGLFEPEQPRQTAQTPPTYKLEPAPKPPTHQPAITP